MYNIEAKSEFFSISFLINSACFLKGVTTPILPIYFSVNKLEFELCLYYTDILQKRKAFYLEILFGAVIVQGVVAAFGEFCIRKLGSNTAAGIFF